MSQRSLRPTPEIISLLTQTIRASLAPPHVAALSIDGITKEAFEIWMTRASTAKRGVYKTLRQEIEKAEATAQILLGVASKSGTQKGAASSWLAWELLRSRYPGWTQPKEIQVKHGVSGDLAQMLRDAQQRTGYDPRAVPIAKGDVIDLSPLCLPPDGYQSPQEIARVRATKTMSRPCRDAFHEHCARKTCRCQCHKPGSLQHAVTTPAEPRPLEVLHSLPADLQL